MNEVRENQKIICWDLDQTLGEFGGVYYLMNPELRGQVPIEYRAILTRHNISPVTEGFTHYLTTSASKNYATEALKRSKIDHLFGERIWDYSAIVDRDGFGKLYRGIEETFLDEEVYQDRMLVVGDSTRDRPADLRRLVFIHQENGYLYDAVVVKKIIDQLLQFGDGSFMNGFERIYESSPIVETRAWRGFGIFPVRTNELLEGISFDLAYVSLTSIRPSPNRNYPIISNIIAPGYQKSPQVAARLFPE